MFRFFPLAKNYADWKQWADALVKQLSLTETKNVLETPVVNSALVPLQGKAGDLIFISDTEKLAYWKPSTNVWRYVDESGNV